jgi:NMD protein affecting ribosome stability and mRNA decay
MTFEHYERLMKLRRETILSCPKCGESFSAEDGFTCAQKNGIKELNVLMCRKCNSVYAEQGIWSTHKLSTDLTDKYAAFLERRKKSFWHRLFGK